MKKSILSILFLLLTVSFSNAKEKRGTALVLSGGGARGISQIGVLKELERQKVKIDYIVGTSIGAVIGGLYCSGYSADEVEQIILDANWDDLLSFSNFYNRDKMFIDQKKYYDRKLINLRFDDYKFQMPKAISNGYHFSEFIQKKILQSPYGLENNFDNLRIPFRAISMDIVTGDVFAFRKGDLMTAMRASTTVPLRFTPVVIDSMILIDGGPVANIPVVQTIEEFNPEKIIAVNTTSDIYNFNDLNNPVNIADQVVSVLMEANKKKAKQISDIYIQPDLENISNIDFVNIEDIIKRGETATQKIDFSSLEKYDTIPAISQKDNYILNNVYVKGNENTDEVFILSELDLSKGDSVDPISIFNFWQRLYSTELFSQVRITTKALDSNKLDLTVSIVENGTQLILLGARVDNERNTQLEIDLLRENFLNTGTRTLIGLSGGGRNQSAILSISNPKLFNLPINFNLTGYYNNRIYRIYGGESIDDNKYSRKQIGEYNVEEFGFNVATGTNFDKKGKINVGFQLGKQRSYNRDDGPKEFQAVSTFFFRTLVDSKNMSNFATQGTLIDLNFESNLLSLENDVNFSKLEFLVDAFFTPIENFTINPFFMFGIGDKTTPLAEFWGLGGQDNFFGMREFEQIGRQIFISSMEFRYKLPFEIFFDTYISARYDVGGVWFEPEQIRFANLRQGIGSTLSFDTPIGPAKFSLGNSFYFLDNPDRVIYGPLLGYFAIGINL